MSFILIVWLIGAQSAPISVGAYSGLVSCEAAGAVWEHVQDGYAGYVHHACVPAP